MEIGVLGLNSLAISLVGHWTTRGHLILLHELSRPELHTVLTPSVSASVLTVPACRIHGRAEIIVIGLPEFDLQTIRTLGEVRHRIVVDLINEGDGPETVSSYLQLQQMFPFAKLVKVSPLDPAVLFTPALQLNSLYCYSHDQLAQRTVKRLLADAGFEVIDLTPQ